MSLIVEVEEVGVRTGDWLAESRAALEDEGEAVPSLESLFFLDALLGSLLRESWNELASLLYVYLFGLWGESHSSQRRQEQAISPRCDALGPFLCVK